MKFVAFEKNGVAAIGLLDDARGVLDLASCDTSMPNNMYALIESEAATFAAVAATAANAPIDFWMALESVRLLAPFPRPRKNIFCVGRNYKLHILEAAKAQGRECSFPKVPEFFTKPITAVIGTNAGIERHALSTDMLDYEVELAIVISKRVRNISAADAAGAIFGYTIVNDVSARDAQRAHGQWFKGKSFDTFCPMGPCIVTADEFGASSGHRISLTVNGETRQDSNTSDLLFSVDEIVSWLSRSMSLEPGDVIATGTPAGVALGMTPPGWLKVGDVVEASVEGIGILKNTIIE
jgi:2-keto-4-pentenoate hydratase/2-oxohepta-3-ene-1,7-dioic acid hydratase in catechol pathway